MMPCAEGRSEAQAADAVRARIAWQDARALDWPDPGVDASVLREFRPRRITGQAARLRCETRLTRCRAPGWLQATGRQRPDATPVLAALQTRKRLEGMGDTLRPARKVLATVAPDGLQSWGPAVWCDRSRQRCADDRVPPETPARDSLAPQLGLDGRPRLGALDDPATPAWRREVPARQTRRQVWLQQFDARPEAQPVRGRQAADLPPAPLLRSSPDDPDARYGKTRQTAWTGDQGPGTDTGDDETPNRMPAVLTTPATTAAVAVRPTMQDNRATRQVTPREPCVEAGDVRADHLLTSRSAQGSDLLGPVPGAQRWPGQAAHGVAAAPLVLDGDAHHAICPHGQRSVVGLDRPARHGHPPVRIACSTPGCAACARRADGTRAATAPRAVRRRARDPYTVLQAARVRQQPDTFTKADARRAGLEGTIAQGPRTGDLRRSRSIGWVKTRLRPLLLAAALNVLRVAAWLAPKPRAQTPSPACAVLSAAAA